MRLKTVTIATALLCLGFTAVTAQETPQAKREQMMKQIGGSVGALGAIAKGEKPYDEATVKKSLTTISTNIKAFPDQFPAGSEANSEAAPAIWQNNADFRAKAAKLGSDADTILAALPADQAGVQKAVQTLGADCGACHQVYRLKK
ncbi:cytochrome C556 [Neorhizobium lilium]|uniref:Cytochrome C556 n=1 Tax=Neorhizobium lilium TaxID=2503024 RepID=A0A444LE43_9HYPH|nr:cytochrome c [Neorhizobium lilium]RWX76079.1 cytochrome C556 [Neorhizobium lilium]